DFEPFEPLFVGLPVDDFALAYSQTSTMDRIPYTRPYDLFSRYNGVPDMFVFVRVLDTEQTEDKPLYRYSGNNTRQRQNSSVQILSTIWSRNDDAPETISITQYLFGGCRIDEPNNLLRKGGVYVLPLEYWANGDTYRIVGELDVLFELDEKGRAWSHSIWEDFKRFDGSDATILLDAIDALTSDENFSAAVTRFGLVVRNDQSTLILMEATHLSATSIKDYFDHDCYEHSFRVDAILSMPENFLHPNVGDEIKAISSSQITQIHLEQGGRYLIFYYTSSEDRPQIWPGSIAKINDDGTISEIFTPPNDDMHRTFEGYDGFTVEQMKEEADRAKAWHEAHAPRT
ncbi:MAG: hypothetical protein FWH48_04670, partial [Oscillospiraceae bacterium]|nr:hypothetical protein [Oscillospiraceae bacterium]